MRSFAVHRVLLMLLVAVPQCVWALSSGADFLRAQIPARPAALGGAFVAIHNDPSAFLWNPAALAWVSQPVLGATHFSSIVDTNFEHASLVQPLNIRGTPGGMGVSIQFSRTSNFEQIDLAGNSVGQVENFDLVALAGYGIKIQKNFSMGINVKGFGSQLAEYQARGIAMDIGAQFKVHRRWSLGIAFNDLGVQQAFDKKADPLPTLLRLGVQSLILDSAEGVIVGVAEVNRPWTTQDRIISSVGLEYWYQDTLAFRMGIRGGMEEGNFTMGLGYRWSGMTLDYAYVPLGDLGVTHRFSMGVLLGTLYEKFLPYEASKTLSHPYGNRRPKKPRPKKITIPERLR